MLPSVQKIPPNKIASRSLVSLVVLLFLWLHLVLYCNLQFLTLITR